MLRCSTSSTRTSIRSWSAVRALPRKPSTRRPPTGRRPSPSTSAIPTSQRQLRAGEAMPPPLCTSEKRAGERFGHDRHVKVGSAVAGGVAWLERPHDPERLQHLPPDLFARLFVHRLCRQPAEPAVEFHRAGELPEPFDRRAYLVE